MRDIHFLTEPFVVCSEMAVNGFKKGIRATAQFSRGLSTCELIVKTTGTIVFLLPYFTLLQALPLTVIGTPLNETKKIFNLLKGARSIEAFVMGLNKTWKLLALNISGLALMIFGSIGFLEKFGVDFTFIHQAEEKVPYFGVLPYAGLLTLATVTLSGSLFFIGLDKKDSLNESEEKILRKINLWKIPLTRDIIAQRYTEDDGINKKWNQVYENFEQLGHLTNEIRVAKEKKWERKLVKVHLEQSANHLGCIKNAAKIGSTLLVTGSIVTGVGVVPAAMVGSILGFGELACALSGYWMKRKASKIAIKPVILESIKTC